MNPLIQLNKATPLFVVPFVLGCLALLERAQTTDLGGVLPGGNTGWRWGPDASDHRLWEFGFRRLCPPQ
jgi:hypothetical protein